MFVVVVDEPVKDDVDASEMMLNAQSSVCAKRNVLLNRYQKWNSQDFWNSFRTTQMRIIY